ncbi:DUF1707 domain-containing protein [Streptomyces sp. MN03-5084-2B]|nr:DUF1707 domain-containing protein [Streptomyces sp. MN03-5084-2B]
MAGKVPRADVRIGHGARAEATGRLDSALREGRIDLAEYERRVVVVQTAKVQKDLSPALAGLPGRSGRKVPTVRISTADRERALVRLADALTDGRLSASAYAEAEELVQRAVTYADLDAVVGNLDAKASHAERDQAVARIEAAVAGGFLDPAEQHDRLAAVRRATTDAQLAALVADLPTDTDAERSPRVSHVDREAVAAQLHGAVEAGLLDLSEFDERVRAVYAARLRDELDRVVADLPPPTTFAVPAPAPAPPVKAARPRWRPSVRSGRRAALIAGLTFFPLYFLVLFLSHSGFTFAADVVEVISGTLLVGLLGWSAYVAARAPEGARRSSKKAPRKWKLGRHDGGLSSLTTLVLPDGTPVAITGGRDNTARVWDLTDGSLRHTLSGHTRDVVGIAAMVLPDGVPVAVTVSPDRTARVWDLRDGSPRGALSQLAKDPHAVRCLPLSDGTPVAVVHDGLKTIQVWDLRNHVLLHSRVDDATFAKAVPVVLSDGTPVVVASDWNGNLRTVHLKSGKTKVRLRGHTDAIYSIDTAVLPGGTAVAVSASEDKTVRVWDLRRGVLLRTMAGLVHPKQAVVCTSLPDGTPVAVACGFHEDTMAWDLRDGSVLPYRRDLWGDVIGAVALPDRTLVLGLTEDECTVGVRLLP